MPTPDWSGIPWVHRYPTTTTSRRVAASPSPARTLLCLVLLVSCLSVPGRYGQGRVMAAPSPPPHDMWTRVWNVPVLGKPWGAVVTVLDIDQEVRVTGALNPAGGANWRRIRLWGALEGWVRADLLSPYPIWPGPRSAGVPVAPNPVGPHAPMPLHARAIASSATVVRGYPSLTGGVLRSLHAGAMLRVRAWATDARGRAWYEIDMPSSGWIDADVVDLLPAAHLAGLAPMRGTGMWLTPAVLHTAPPEAIVAAAHRDGITHLYVEVANSRLPGVFSGAGILNAILPPAHRAHIAVLAWVYPFLDDTPLDVAVALTAARYVTPGGERPDGLASDIEQNMSEPYVHAYSQIVRARLGPRVLMVAAVYPPQSYWGSRFPYRTVARSWDVIVPMDYWHLRPRTYTPDEAYRYVAASIQGIRAAGGRSGQPIEILGQMFDVYGNGRQSPTASEIAAAGKAARDGHALAISFFEWNHATPDEWDALRALQHRSP